MPVETDDLSKRLQDQLAQARPAPTKTAPPPASSPATPPPDDLGRRLAAESERAADKPSTSGFADESAPEPIAGHGPVGGGEHIVRVGECISSIACEAGLLPETIWEDTQNAELREVRQDSNVLLPGDRVHVPPLREKSEPGQTEMRHRFHRKGWPETLRVRLLRDDDPRGNEPYTLEVDGVRLEGTTDAEGQLNCPIVPNARRALVCVGKPGDQQEFELQLGEIDPIDEIIGVQQRLTNLGVDCGEIDGKFGPATEDALRTYQRKRDLPVTGEPDQETRDRLKSDYGC